MGGTISRSMRLPDRHVLDPFQVIATLTAIDVLRWIAESGSDVGGQHKRALANGAAGADRHAGQPDD
jgi:hypothetical protein